jgi:hypothetical protein
MPRLQSGFEHFMTLSFRDFFANGHCYMSAPREALRVAVDQSRLWITDVAFLYKPTTQSAAFTCTQDAVINQNEPNSLGEIRCLVGYFDQGNHLFALSQINCRTHRIWQKRSINAVTTN